jgi:hypothetical protein
MYGPVVNFLIRLSRICFLNGTQHIRFVSELLFRRFVGESERTGVSITSTMAWFILFLLSTRIFGKLRCTDQLLYTFALVLHLLQYSPKVFQYFIHDLAIVEANPLAGLVDCLPPVYYVPLGTRKRQKNKKRNSPIIVLLYFKQYSVRFQGSTYQKLFFLTTLTTVVIYGASTHLHVSWILKCGYINQIRFSLHEAMITMITPPSSQSSGIGL